MDLKPLSSDGPLSHIPLIIAGPCSAESREQVLSAATALKEFGTGIFRAGIWKPRTMPGGFEGVGERGLEWLAEVREITGMAVATEVASPRHVESASSFGIDLFWIGARTASDPFAMQELAEAVGRICPDKPVLVKNPVVADIDLWIGAICRLYDAGVTRLGAIHRGFRSIGHNVYRNHPRWSLPLELRRRLPGLPLLCDPSHIGGSRDLIEPLSQEALAMGFDGLIVEVHCNPDSALSDSIQQITPECFSRILSRLNFRNMKVADGELDQLRLQIDQLDTELLEILSRRMTVSREIGHYKKNRNIPVVQTERFEKLVKSRTGHGGSLGMSEEFLSRLFSDIHEESVRQQLEI